MRSKMNRMMAQAVALHTASSGRSKPAAQTVEDKTTPLQVPPDIREWMAVMLSPKANDGTMARIDAAGFDVWRPRTVVRISSASLSKAAFVNRPLWPRYAFVARRPGCTMSLSDVWSIGKPLTVGSLSGRIVSSIAAREAAGEFDCRTLPQIGPVFSTGAAVETLDGLLHGIVHKSDEARTIVLFRMLDADRAVVVETAKLRESA